MAQFSALFLYFAGTRRHPGCYPDWSSEVFSADLAFLERAFGFREIPTARRVSPAGVVGHSMVEFGDSVIGIGTQGAHGAFSPKAAGTASHYISVYIDDIDAHYQRALAAGAQIASAPHAHRTDYRAYEALHLAGHRWRFVQWLQEASREK